MIIETNFCGGNAANITVDSDRVKFTPDLRDTTEKWFYWAIRVRGAAGRTIRFEPGWVGYFGAAVSHDLENWQWSGNASDGGFTYTFGEAENVVYFAHDMLYHPSRFEKFAEERGLFVKTCCSDNKGAPMRYLTVGKGEKKIILTARHHACESTGDYVMEGIIDEFMKSPIENCRIIAIPFIDADGVAAGDQGKARAPHDHNRDYEEFLYNGTKFVKTLMDEGKVIAVFDLHSPWHSGGRNDKVFCVRNNLETIDKMRFFGRCFEETITPGAMKYSSSNDIDPGVDWNRGGKHIACASYCSDYPGVELSFTLETTYFGEPGNIVSQDKLVETGRCFLNAFRRYLDLKNIDL